MCAPTDVVVVLLVVVVVVSPNGLEKIDYTIREGQTTITTIIKETKRAPLGDKTIPILTNREKIGN